MSEIFEKHLAELAQTTSRQQAFIREDECIGCMKCIKACPVDAILGTNKQMHTVIKSDCTGCELCVAPCPVDCIDMLNIADIEPAIQTTQLNHFHQRYQQHQVRAQKEAQQLKVHTKKVTENTDKKAYIQSALLRVKEKKKLQHPNV